MHLCYRNFSWIRPTIEGATLVETHLSSSEVRKRLHVGRNERDKKRAISNDRIVINSPKPLIQRRKSRSADDIVREAIMNPRVQSDYYSEVQGLVPNPVISYMKRYNLYSNV